MANRCGRHSRIAEEPGSRRADRGRARCRTRCRDRSPGFETRQHFADSGRRIKILDFGLAKVKVSRTAAAVTETLTVRTEPGV